MAVLGFVFVGAPAFAEDDDPMADRWYVSGNLGLNFATSVEINPDLFKISLDPAYATWANAAEGSQDVGSAFGAGIGIDGGGFIFELRVDNVHSKTPLDISGSTYDGKSNLTTFLFEPKVEIGIVPKLDFYFGAGVGGGWYRYTIDGYSDAYYEDVKVATLAYSAVGGFLFKLTDNLGVDASYRYLSTAQIEYETTDIIQPRIHTAQVGVRWYFADL